MLPAPTSVASGRLRPFRFAVGGPMEIHSRADLVDHVRSAEQRGFDLATFPDHLFLGLDPIVAMAVAAEASERIRIGTLMLAAGLRNPVMLAKQLASLDLVSDGRLEVGIGAGWHRGDFDASGLPFAPATERIAQLEETIAVLRGIWAGPGFSFNGRFVTAAEVPSVPPPVQKDGPPILMGGGGKLILRASGRGADTVTIAGQPMAKSDGLPNRSALGERVQWVAAAADEVGRHPELHILLSQVVVTSNARTAARDLLAAWPGGAARPPTEDDLLASPFIAIGSVARITEQLLGLREEFGISFISVRASMAAEMVPVIEAMANR